MLVLVKPSLDSLSGYKAALNRGWSPDNLSTERKRQEELGKIAASAADFVASFEYPGPEGQPVTLPDGSTVACLPRFGRWLWDGEFCGHIGFRWQRGSTELPPTCLGHIGYSVVPWKQKRGYATEALRLLLKDIQGWLPYVVITTEPDNVPSQRVVLANGGYLVERFVKPPMFGGTEALRFRVDLSL